MRGKLLSGFARRVAGTAPDAPGRAQAKPEVTSELAAVRAGLSELQRKIAQLEAKVSSESGDPASGFQNSAPAGVEYNAFNPAYSFSLVGRRQCELVTSQPGKVWSGRSCRF